jgi:hypothetical protein
MMSQLSNIWPKATWLPTSCIEAACGGADIVPCSHYVRSEAHESNEIEYEKAMRRQFRRRLEYTVTQTAAPFLAYNRGFTKIMGLDDVGMLRWRLHDTA